MSDVITTTRTDDEPPATRMDYWRQAACDAMVPVDLRIDQRDGYHGQLVQNDLGSTQITDVIVSPTLIRRTPQLIRRSDPGLYKVELQTRGHSLFAQDDRTALLSAGDLTICQLSRPYELTYSPRAHYSQSPGTLAQMVTFTFPPTSLPLPPDDMASLTATRIPGHAPIMGLLAPILRHLARWPAEDDVVVARRLSSTVIDSVRHLQNLFADEGMTVTDHIRRRRLEQCERDLVDPACARRPVAAIAARWGFGSTEHFNRLSRATYGTPPAQYRRILLGNDRAQFINDAGPGVEQARAKDLPTRGTRR